MKLYCPKCKENLEVDIGIDGEVECPSCAEVIDVSALRAATCPICGCAFEETDEIRICPDCKVPHHDECWEENRGCSTYGCASAAHQETHTVDNTSVGSDNNAGMVPCPACGALHPVTDLICIACGKLLSDKLLADNATPGTILWSQLERNFRLLGQNAAAVFRLWKRECSRCVKFSGVTSRREYLAFSGVNMAVIWLISVCGATHHIFLVSVLVFLPTLAATVRRLRDTDISPLMIFAIPLLPFLLLVPTVASKEVS